MGTLSKKEKKEILKGIADKAIPKNHPLVGAILGPTPKTFEEVLEEKGISVIR